MWRLHNEAIKSSALCQEDSGPGKLPEARNARVRGGNGPTAADNCVPRALSSSFPKFRLISSVAFGALGGAWSRLEGPK